MCTAHQLDANPIKSSIYYYSSNLITGNKNYIVNFPDFYLNNFTHFDCISGFLWVGAFVGWIRYVTEWTVNPRIWGDCKLYRFLFFFCEHYSSALLVIMSLEKFFALYFPLKTRSVCTVHSARWASAITGLIFIIFNTQAFFIYDAQVHSNGGIICIYIRVPETYRLVFYRLNSVLYSFGPFILMIMFNSAIYLQISQNKVSKQEC